MTPEHAFLAFLGLLLALGAVNSVRALQRRWVAAGGSARGGLWRGMVLIVLGLFGAWGALGAMTSAFQRFGWGGLVFVFGACLLAALLIQGWIFTPPARTDSESDQPPTEGSESQSVV